MFKKIGLPNVVPNVVTDVTKNIQGAAKESISNTKESISNTNKSISNTVQQGRDTIGQINLQGTKESFMNTLKLPQDLGEQIHNFSINPGAVLDDLEHSQISHLLHRYLKKLHKKKKLKIALDKSDDKVIEEWIEDISGDICVEQIKKPNQIYSFEGFQRRFAQLRFKYEEKLDDHFKKYPTSVKSAIYFGIADGDGWSHLKMKPEIRRIHKISLFLNEDHLEAMQVTYILSDGKEWQSPLHGSSSRPPQEVILEENDTITSVEGRAAKVIYCLTFQIRRANPDGTFTNIVFHPTGGTGGQRFSLTSSLPIISFYGSSDHKGHINSIGFFFSQHGKDAKGKDISVHTWNDAVDKNRCISFYYLPFYQFPGFSVPSLLFAESNIADLVIDSFLDLLWSEEDKKSREIIEKAQVLKLLPDIETLLEYSTETGIVIFQTNYAAPLYPHGKNTFDLPPGQKWKLLLSAFDYLCTLPMDIIITVLGKTLGWNIKGLKIVFYNQSKYRAYEKMKGQPEIWVTESERSAHQKIILRDIKDTSLLYQIFENKYKDVMHKAENDWKAKVDEYNNIKKDWNKVDPEKRKEYKNFFIQCKKDVHDTLELIDFKYTLYYNRWQELRSLADYEKDNYHDIPDLPSLTDVQITDLLIGRAEQEHKEFCDFLKFLEKSFNRIASIGHICRDLGIKQRIYPLNMTRKLIVSELLNTEKVELKIGPIKTKERGLQKVIETKDKTQSLLDTLRATILCKDPVVPLMVIEYLKNEGKLTRVKNKTSPTEGYKCVHINFCMGKKPRTIYELQVVFKEYYDLQKKDHDYYEIIRTFPE